MPELSVGEVLFLSCLFLQWLIVNSIKDTVIRHPVKIALKPVTPSDPLTGRDETVRLFIFKSLGMAQNTELIEIYPK